MKKNTSYTVGRGLLVLATVLVLIFTASVARAEEHSDKIQDMKMRFQERIAVIEAQIAQAKLRIDAALSSAEAAMQAPPADRKDAVEQASVNVENKLQEIKAKIDVKVAEMKEDRALKRALTRAEEMEAYATRTFSNALAMMAEAELAALYALESRVEAEQLLKEANKE